MPSKKKNTRAAQLQPQPQPTQQSDYDTDTANATDVAPSMAPPPARTNTELNLLVLRRYVPNVERIISIAPFAVVYIFLPETQQWEKSGVEGTLFVCQLSGSPYPQYKVVILNRKSLDNFITEIMSGEDIEVTEQYVILQVLGEDGNPNIYGLWIFSDDESVPNTREVVASAIQECALRAEHAKASANGYSAPPSYNLDGTAESPTEDTATPIAPQATGQQIDLLSLFSKPPAVANPGVTEPSQMEMSDSMLQPPESHLNRFTSATDTDFFRTSRSPAAAQPAQQPPPQQNKLLELFKNAKKG